MKQFFQSLKAIYEENDAMESKEDLKKGMLIRKGFISCIKIRLGEITQEKSK